MPNSHDQIGSSDDTRVNSIQYLPSPERILLEKPIDWLSAKRIIAWRKVIADIIHGRSDRLLVVVGPCSIHDTLSALEYSEHVRSWRESYGEEMEIVMRTYWEKPRTTVGWKGLINDPDMDGTNRIEKGLRTARNLLCDINGKGVPTATEFLDPISPQFYADLISWGAIGARTTESQIHRELASGLSCPIGFKNGTDGSVQIAVDAMRASAGQHTFLGAGKDGRIGIVNTSGNEDSHIILRGSNQGTNYDEHSVRQASKMAKKSHLPNRVMIDVSHQNSQKDYRRQMEGIDAAVSQIRQKTGRVLGVMIESHLFEGKQSHVPGKDDPGKLEYGISITDACVNIRTTQEMLKKLAMAKRAGF